MAEREPYVFISYSHSDVGFAIGFSKRLSKARVKYFRDTSSIGWGESIPQRVREALEHATHLIVIISPGSEKSQWVAYEMGYAHGKNVALVPYLLHPDMEIPGFISNRLCIKTRKDEKDFICTLMQNLTSNIVSDIKACPENYNPLCDNVFNGHYELIASNETINKFYSDKELDGIKQENGEDLPCNTFVRLISDQNKSQSAVGRIASNTGKLVPVKKVPSNGIWSIFARNLEQWCALDLLTNESVEAVSLFGSIYSKKSLLAIAAGLDQVVEQSKYQRLIISRPISELMSREINLLEDAGLKTWMQPYFDNFEVLLSGQKPKDRKNKGYKELMAMGILDIEPLSGFLGRCIEYAYIIVDDVQSLTTKEIKVLFDGVGEQSKLVLLSNISKNNKTPFANNTFEILTILNKLIGRNNFGHIALTEDSSESLFDRIGVLF